LLPILPGSQACSRKAVPMCDAKLPPSNMVTEPSAAAADDVHGSAWRLADLLAPHPTPACCQRDLRGHVVDEVPPVLLNVESKVAFLISNDGRTSLPGAAVRSIA